MTGKALARQRGSALTAGGWTTSTSGARVAIGAALLAVLLALTGALLCFAPGIVTAWMTTPQSSPILADMHLTWQEQIDLTLTGSMLLISYSFVAAVIQALSPNRHLFILLLGLLVIGTVATTVIGARGGLGSEYVSQLAGVGLILTAVQVLLVPALTGPRVGFSIYIPSVQLAGGVLVAIAWAAMLYGVLAQTLHLNSIQALRESRAITGAILASDLTFGPRRRADPTLKFPENTWPAAYFGAVGLRTEPLEKVGLDPKNLLPPLGELLDGRGASDAHMLAALAIHFDYSDSTGGTGPSRCEKAAKRLAATGPDTLLAGPEAGTALAALAEALPLRIYDIGKLDAGAMLHLCAEGEANDEAGTAHGLAGEAPAEAAAEAARPVDASLRCSSRQPDGANPLRDPPALHCTLDRDVLAAQLVAFEIPLAEAARVVPPNLADFDAVWASLLAGAPIGKHSACPAEGTPQCKTLENEYRARIFAGALDLTRNSDDLKFALKLRAFLIGIEQVIMLALTAFLIFLLAVRSIQRRLLEAVAYDWLRTRSAEFKRIAKVSETGPEWADLKCETTPPTAIGRADIAILRLGSVARINKVPPDPAPDAPPPITEADVAAEYDRRAFTLRSRSANSRWMVTQGARILPAVGFIGTVRGIMDALGSADTIVRATDSVSQAAAVTEVAGILGISFTTTFVALVLGIAVGWVDAYQAKEERETLARLREHILSSWLPSYLAFRKG